MDKKMADFERIAERRVQETIKKMQLIGNLSNKNSYAYTEQHLEQIFGVLEQEILKLKEQFKADDHSRARLFSFKKDD